MTFHLVRAHDWMSVFMMQVNRMNVYLQNCEIKECKQQAGQIKQCAFCSATGCPLPQFYTNNSEFSSVHLHQGFWVCGYVFAYSPRCSNNAILYGQFYCCMWKRHFQLGTFIKYEVTQEIEKENKGKNKENLLLSTNIYYGVQKIHWRQLIWLPNKKIFISALWNSKPSARNGGRVQYEEVRIANNLIRTIKRKGDRNCHYISYFLNFSLS